MAEAAAVLEHWNKHVTRPAHLLPFCHMLAQVLVSSTPHRYLHLQPNHSLTHNVYSYMPALHNPCQQRQQPGQPIRLIAASNGTLG